MNDNDHHANLSQSPFECMVILPSRNTLPAHCHTETYTKLFQASHPYLTLALCLLHTIQTQLHSTWIFSIKRISVLLFRLWDSVFLTYLIRSLCCCRSCWVLEWFTPFCYIRVCSSAFALSPPSKVSHRAGAYFYENKTKQKTT